MLFECSVCGERWYGIPAKVLYGQGCPKCTKKRMEDKKRYTKDEFSEKVLSIQPSIHVIGDYKNSVTKIEVYCDKCGNKWKVVPSSLLSGTGCPKCNKRYRRSTEEFSQELNRINPHLEVLGTYVNANKKIKVKCRSCGTEWLANPIGLLRGNDCPNCRHSQTSIIEQVIYITLCQLLGEDHVRNRDKSLIDKELDIYVPDLKLAIEFGAWYWHEKRISLDAEKVGQCEKKNVKLITVYEGCPKGINSGIVKNAIYYSNIISAEKDFSTIKRFLLSICNLYGLNKSLLVSNWEGIIRQARENSRKRDAEDFERLLKEQVQDIKYISGYTGSGNPVCVECEKCGTRWNASSAYDLLHGHGCPKCGRQKANQALRKSIDEYKEKVNKVNPQIKSNRQIICTC